MQSGIIVVNKEKDMTSRDVVNKVSKILNTKKIGHTGTLDPIATGVLVLCIGNSTKLCEILTSEYKEYIATIKLGIKTDTLDITGKIIEKKEYNLEEKQIKDVLKTFIGTSIQTTPLYSAVKINGKKLYEYARTQQHIELPKREINIKEIELLKYDKDKIVFKTMVSKGTYIRALIDDICTKLNTVGTMFDLVRTKQGLFSIDESYSLEDVAKKNYKILSNEEVLKNIKTVKITNDIYKKVKNGAIIPRIFDGNIACLEYNKKIIAIYQKYSKDSKLAKPYKMLEVNK